jgi:hypothetical protein
MTAMLLLTAAGIWSAEKVPYYKVEVLPMYVSDFVLKDIMAKSPKDLWTIALQMNPGYDENKPFGVMTAICLKELMRVYGLKGNKGFQAIVIDRAVSRTFELEDMPANTWVLVFKVTDAPPQK